MLFEIKEISEVIAERRLYLEGQPGTIIRILLGKPQRAPSPSNEDAMLCPHQIIGVGTRRVRSAWGVDGFQALRMAMQMIGSELYFSLNRKFDGKEERQATWAFRYHPV